MKFSIGDKILMKKTGEEGHVTAYINKEMLEVEVGGTAFPVYMEDIDHPYLKWFTDKAPKKKSAMPWEVPLEKAAERKQRLAKGVYLSFLPVYKWDGIEDVVELLKVYLLNELPQPIKAVYDVRMVHKSEFKHEGTVQPFGHIYLHNMPYADMNDQPRFHWQLTDVQNQQMEVAEGILRIRPAKLFEHIHELMQKGEPSFSYLLIDDFKAKQLPEPNEKKVLPPPPGPAYKPLVTAATIDKAKYEIDLHIEQLVGSARSLSNAEIITIQLNNLQRNLQLAVVHRQERMIVIHGLGKGILRDEVHKILKQTPEVSRYKNEWSGKYGFGATEVFFRY